MAPRHLLIVDDDAGIRLLLVTFFRRCGFQSQEACNGREALDGMRAGNIDLVIMDLMMPEVSGWDVLCERERDRSLRRIPILVVTAMNVKQARESVAGKGVSMVLGKPFDLAALLASVRKSLREAHLPAPVAA